MREKSREWTTAREHSRSRPALWRMHLFFWFSVFTAIAILMTVNFQVEVSARGKTVGSVELIENGESWDGQEVEYTGEVVGAILMRSEHAWLTVNDDHYSKRHLHRYQELKGGNSGIAVRCSREQAEKITRVGSYKSSGDIVRVSGTFYRSNPRYGGDLMIEAITVEVVRRGKSIPQKGAGALLPVSLILFALCAFLGVLWARMNYRL